MRKSAKILHILSNIYVALAVFTIGLIIFMYLSPYNAKGFLIETFQNVNLHGLDLTTFIFIILEVEAFGCFIYAWLLKRIADKKSKGIFVIVLLALSIIGNLYLLTQQIDILNIVDLFFNMIVIIIVFLAKNE